MTIPPLTVRPVIHTAHIGEWLEIFRALGAHTLSEDPMWTELQLDRGRVTLSVLNRDAAEGDVSLGFDGRAAKRLPGLPDRASGGS